MKLNKNIAGLILSSVLCLIYGTESLSQTTLLRLPGAQSVIEAGAYSSLQQAINAIPQTGGMLQIPPGVFEITEPLIIDKTDVTIRGSGTATHIKNINDEGKSAIIIQHPSKIENRKNELWRVNLSNLRITGNEKSGHGIEVRRINELFINGITVSYHGGDGIHLHYCFEDPRISNSLITYNKKSGLYIHSCHDIVVSANHFEENYDGVHCVNSPNLCMNGNNLDDHLGSAIVLEGTLISVISGNMIEQCEGTGMVVDKDSHGNTISSNIFTNNKSGGLDLRDAHGCAVSANTFINMPVNALRIGPQSGRITVTGNNFSNNYIGEGKLHKKELIASGIVLEGTSDVCIVGNLFAGVRPEALTFQREPSERINFTGNVFTDVPGGHKQLKNSVVENNLEQDLK